MVPAGVKEHSMTRDEFVRRHGPWLAFLIAAAAYFPRFAHDSPGLLYRQAGECLFKQQVLQACVPPFTYPPAFAFTMIPFALLPEGLWNIAWYLVTLAATVISYRLAEALALHLVPGPWPPRDLARLRIAALLLSVKFILAVYENQAYDLFVLPFTLYGLLCLVEKREIAGAASLALAAALKAMPLIFLPYLLLRRRFAGAAVFVAVLAGASFLPDVFLTPQGAGSGYFMTWLRDIASGGLLEQPAAGQAPFWAGANPLNHSIHGAIARLVDGTSYQGDFLVILRAAQLLFAGILGLLLILSARRDSTIPVDGALLIVAMLMLSPMTSRSHYVTLMLPYTVLVAYWLRDRRTRRVGAIVLAVSFVLATATSSDLVGHALTDWAYRTSQMELGAMVLIVYLAVIILNSPGERVRPAKAGLASPTAHDVQSAIALILTAGDDAFATRCNGRSTGLFVTRYCATWPSFICHS
jgi:glycosyl transferase family 87